ncbi:MAG: hypothetical protein HOV79_15640 [Hamadaea sp.]|nr:hypothetical protein [Hamadaea sp.]
MTDTLSAALAAIVLAAGCCWLALRSHRRGRIIVQLKGERWSADGAMPTLHRRALTSAAAEAAAADTTVVFSIVNIDASPTPPGTPQPGTRSARSGCA